MGRTAFIKFLYLSSNFYMLSNQDRTELFLQNQDIERLRTKEHWCSTYETYLKKDAKPIYLTIRKIIKGIIVDNTLIPMNMLSNEKKQEYLRGELEIIEKEQKRVQKYYDIKQIDCSEQISKQILKNEIKNYNNEKLYNTLILFFNRLNIYIDETTEEFSFYNEEKIYISNIFGYKQRLSDLLDIASYILIDETTTLTSIFFIKLEKTLLKSMLKMFFKLEINKFDVNALEDIYNNIDDEEISESIQRCCNILKFFNDEFLKKNEEEIYVKGNDEEELVKQQIVNNLLDGIDYVSTNKKTFKNIKKRE